jgi:hypothetical protein
MPTFDFHQHLWPDPFVAALRARRASPRLEGDVLYLGSEPPAPVDLGGHRLERRLELLDRDRIDVAIVSLQTGIGIERLSDAEQEELVGAWEEGMRDVCAASEGRVRTLAPGRALDGHCGACVGAPALLELDTIAPLLGELERRAMPLFVHPGPAAPPDGAPLWWGALVDYTAGMQTAHAAWLAHGVARWPRLNVVFAMLAGGAPFHIERFQSRGVSERAILTPTVFFETSSYGRRALELTLATVGVGQLVYGSDLPIIDTEMTLQAIRGFGDALAECLLVTNPTRLLP